MRIPSKEQIAQKLMGNKNFIAFLTAFGRLAEKVQREVSIIEKEKALIVNASRLSVGELLNMAKPLIAEKLQGKEEVIVILPNDFARLLGKTKDGKLVLVIKP